MTVLDAREVAGRAVTEYGAVQHPWELAAVLDLLAARPPGLILEIGCWSGGGLYAWRAVCPEVIGLTLPEYGNVLRSHGTEIVWADSRRARDPLLDQLAGRIPGFVFIDGDHSYEVVMSDWKLARDIAPGAVIGFHDITHPDYPGVARAWAEVRPGHPSIEIIHPDGMGTGLVFT